MKHLVRPAFWAALALLIAVTALFAVLFVLAFITKAEAVELWWRSALVIVIVAHAVAIVGALKEKAAGEPAEVSQDR